MRKWKQLEEALKDNNEDERIVMGLDFLIFSDEQPLLAQQVCFASLANKCVFVISPPS